MMYDEDMVYEAELSGLALIVPHLIVRETISHAREHFFEHSGLFAEDRLGQNRLRICRYRC